MRILIADDQEMCRDILRFALERAGHDVDCAQSGKEALAAFSSGEYGLVISDWEMPEMDGLELCRAIRGQDRNGHVHFLLLTSHDGSALTMKGLAAGADGFISKPFDLDQLIARVRDAGGNAATATTVIRPGPAELNAADRRA